MTADLIPILLLSISFLALFSMAEIIYHVKKVEAEYTRKLVHAGTGILTLLFPVFLNSHWSVLILCGSFALILIFSLKFNLLKSINAIDRQSHGSISYPISVYVCFLFFTWTASDTNTTPFLQFYIPILLLALCDPAAALLGRKFPIRRFKVGDGYKSWGGCLAFFLTACTVQCILWYCFYGQLSATMLLPMITLSLLSTLAEAWSPKGLDNLSIPISSAICLYLFRNAYFI